MSVKACYSSVKVQCFSLWKRTSSSHCRSWELPKTEGPVQPEEEKAARGPYKCLQISEGWVSGGWGQALFSGAQ